MKNIVLKRGDDLGYHKKLLRGEIQRGMKINSHLLHSLHLSVANVSFFFASPFSSLSYMRVLQDVFETQRKCAMSLINLLQTSAYFYPTLVQAHNVKHI